MGDNDKIDLMKIINVYKAEWKIILFVFTILVFGTGLYLKFIIRSYYSASSTFILKVEDKSQGDASLGVLGALSGGMDAGTTDINHLAFLTKDPNFNMDFITKYKLLPIIFESQWDTLKSDWKEEVYRDSLILDEQAGISPLKKLVVAKFDKKENAVEVKSRVFEKQFAKVIVDQYVHFIDSVLVNKKQDDAKKKIRHLETRYLESKGLLSSSKFEDLISVQYEKLALFSESAIEKVIHSIEPRKSSGPNKILILVVMMVVSFLLGSIIVFLKCFYKEYANEYSK